MTRLAEYQLIVTTIDETEVRRKLERLESLIKDIELLGDATARAHAREMVQSLLEFHGAAVARILDRIAETGEPGLALIEGLGRDDLVSSLLLLYGLHPLDFETRVQQSLEKVRPLLRSHGGNVELLGTGGGVVRLRMLGSCHGCPSSALTLKHAIEEAIYAGAPDAESIEVEGVVEAPPAGGIIQIAPLSPTLSPRSSAVTG
jgi:Fe-S cluster biogenesis protein NfuA